MNKDKKHFALSGLLPQILCGLMLSFTVFVFAPIDMYALNVNNFWFGFEHFVPMFLGFFAISFVLVQIVFSLLKLLPRGVYLVFLALLFGLSLAIYIQGNYLCLTNEVMGGDTPDWQAMLIPMLINCVIWFVIIAAALVFVVAKPKVFLKAVSFISALVLIMECVSMGVSLLNTGEKKGFGVVYSTVEDGFTVSQNGDVIVLMPDTLDVRLFDQILEENPEFLDEFDGFTYYRNNGGLFHMTYASVVGMLTGELCKNEEPFYEFANSAFSESEFFPTLIENGFTVNTYATPNGIYAEDMLEQIDNLSTRSCYVSKPVQFAVFMLRMIGYRYAPTAMQPFLFGDFEQLFTYTVGYSEGSAAESLADDDVFYNSLLKNGITVDNSRRFFKFYKMKGAHSPINMNRNAEPVESNSVTRYDQTLGCFKVIGEYLSELKANGAYDSSTIIILADHGINTEHDCSTPMMLVKYPNQRSEGEIIISDAPTSLLDMRATALYGAGLDYESFGTPVHMWEGVEDRERYYYSYHYMRPTGYSFYLDTITEYKIPADATDLDSYVATGNVY